MVAAGATRIDLEARTLMPGLIDCHVHMFMNEMNIGLLMRGYTTVSDVSGGDHEGRAVLQEHAAVAPLRPDQMAIVGPVAWASATDVKTR